MNAYKILGSAHLKKRECDDAILCERCLAIAQESGDRVAEMKAYMMLGSAHLKGEYDNAISQMERCLATAKISGIKANKPFTKAHLEKEYDDPILCGKEYLNLVQEPGAKVAEIDALDTLANAHSKKQEYDDAISYGEKCLPIAQKCGDKEEEMKAYMMLDQAHLKKQEYDDAISYVERCLAMAHESGDKVAEMNAYVMLGAAYVKKGKYDDAISYGEKCLSIAQECGDKEAEMKAYILLGNAYLIKQEYDDAISYGEKWLSIARECGDKEAEMQAYLLLGNSYWCKQENDDAISYGEKCLHIAQECGDKEEEMKAYILLGNAYFNKQENDDAISYGEKCLHIAQECGDKEDEMKAYILLGNAYLKKQEYDDAISYGEKCLSIAQESGDKTAEMQAYVLLGKAYLNKQQNDDAISCSEKCLLIREECGDKDVKIKVCKSLGNIYFNREKYDEAISYYEKRLSIAQQSNYKVTEMKTYLLIGKTRLRKEEYEEAIHCGRKCLTIAQQSGDKEKEMDAYSLMGTAQLRNNAYDDAYSCFTEGKKLAMHLQDDYRMLTFKMYLDMTFHEVSIETWDIFDAEFSHANFQLYNEHGDSEQLKHGIAEIYVKLGKFDEAMKYHQEALAVAVTRSQQAASHFSLGILYYNPYRQLDEAKKSLEESLKCYELIFKDLKENDRFKIGFVDKYKEAYKMLLKVLIETNKKEEALVLSDRYRAKALKDVLVSSYGMKEDPTAEETDYLQYADVQSLVSSRNYSLLFYSTCDEKLCAFLVEAGKELDCSVQHFEYCETCLDKLVDKAFDEMKVGQVVNCEDRSLDVKDDSEENKSPKEDELTCMLTRQKEERLAEQCRYVCGCRGEPSENTDETSLTSGLEILYQKLIHNIKCSVAEEEIVIIPEGPLCKVPFAALQEPDTGQYLSETKRIRMAPSMATLKLLQEYPEEHLSSKEALIIGAGIIGLVKLNEVENKIPTLPGAIDEAIDIGKILGVRPLLGAKATKARVIKRLQEGASIVHIAAHGSLEKASILLAPPEIGGTKIPDEEDYMLTMAEVQQSQVRAQLVVLSCCHSGRGEIKAEGVVGMCRAFLASGARAVMGSLWAVADEATRMFMETFYKYLKDGKSASTSLQMTMNDMRRTPKYGEPMYWAPFFLMGDDVTIKFED